MSTIFGYGSLIFAPERPELVRRRGLGTLEGYRRRFNKKSCNRYCPRELAFGAFDSEELPPGFELPDRYVSLVLGTEPKPGGTIVGVCLDYEPTCFDEVLEATDRREGYDQSRDSRMNGYLRQSCEITRHETGARELVTTYLSNPDPAQLFFVSPRVSLDARARLLINATPRDPDYQRSGLRATGLDYLEGVRGDLRAAAIVDPELEAIAEAALELDGPWCSRIALPR